MLQSKLESAVGKSNVVTDPERLGSVSRDETPGLKPALPAVWVKPGSALEVQQVVQICSEAGVGLTARGGGTGKSGGAVPVAGGVVISFERMNRLVEIDRENLIARVQPGLVLAEFQDAVAAAGLFYPPDPVSAQWCTLGGNVAENASGPTAIKYGSTRDYVLGLELVLPTGELVQVGKQTVKGVTGYDLPSLICGSEGTLAIVTQITVKLLPKPRAIQTAWLTFKTAKEASFATTAILTSGILPRCLEYMDQLSLAAVGQQDAGAALLVETDGESHDSAFNQLMLIEAVVKKQLAKPMKIASDEKQRRELWHLRKSMSEATKKLKKHKVSEDVVVPRAKIPELVARLEALGETHGLTTCAFGHAGDGNVHAQVLFDDEAELPKVEALLEELFRETVLLGGTITGEHGIGVAKKRFLQLEQSREVIALQRRIKMSFDPNGILNPGKFLPD